MVAIQHKIECRCYGSVSEFAVDLGLAFNNVPGLENVRDIFEAQSVLASSTIRDEVLSDAEKDLKKLAKRIVKLVQQPLKEAFLRETELGGQEYHERLQYLRDLPEKDARSYLSPQIADQSIQDAVLSLMVHANAPESAVINGMTDNPPDDTEEVRDSIEQAADTIAQGNAVDGEQAFSERHKQQVGRRNENDENLPATEDGERKARDALSFLRQGGTPWYLEHFEPEGLALQEERWTGPEVVRGMSEELSEMDDDELQGLGPASEHSENDEQSHVVALSQPSRSSRRQRV
ncbi:MAG: hypothetical protein Q9162_000092 [Coniocarpon cinnabarinum]